MRKRMILLLLIMAALTVFTACNPQQIDNSTASSGTDQLCADGVARFDSEEEFILHIQSQKNDYNTAQTNDPEEYYILKNVPVGYELYKITAGVSDVGFWYLPSEYLDSANAIAVAESNREYFMLISPKIELSLTAVLSQSHLTGDDLISGKYYFKESPNPKIIWEHDGHVMMLYIPESYKAIVSTDVENLCELNRIYP